MDRKRLLPKLRNERWMGWTELPSRELLKVPLKGLPRVGIGEDTRERFTFVQHTDLGTPDTLAELEAIAVRNLANRPEHWNVKEKSKGLLGFRAKPRLIELTAEHAVERVLDVAFMRKAHEMLDASLVVIGIPVRGILWARAAPADVADGGEFLACVRKAFADAPKGLEPLTPIVLSVQDGKLIGAATGMKHDEEIQPRLGFPWPTQGAAVALDSENADDGTEDSDDAESDARPGSRRLQRIGYEPATQTVEYACHVAAGETIPREEVALIEYILKRRMLGRSPIKVVRIACPDRRIAEQIAPQIRPTGAMIVFMNDEGEDQPL